MTTSLIEKISEHFKGKGQAILMKGVTVQKDQSKLIEDVSFYLSRGEILGIIGASGAGKTTSLRVLTGQLKPTKGKVLVLGLDVTNKRSRDALRLRTGFVPQLGSHEDVYMEFNAIQNAIHFGRMYRLRTKEIKKRAKEILSILGFDSEELLKKSAKNLSGGELKRVSIAVGLIHKPEILFLDEPTTGLDPTLRIEVLNFLKHLNKTTRVTIVIVSHDLETASYCDKIVILKEGHVVGFGDPAEMIKSISGGKAARVIFKKRFFSQEILNKIKSLPNVQYVLKTGRRTLKIFAPDLPNSLEKLLDGFKQLKMSDLVENIIIDKIIFMDYFRIKMEES